MELSEHDRVWYSGKVVAPPKVGKNLNRAYDSYWASKSHREQQMAYHEILLFGGNDGYPSCNKWRLMAAKYLRRMALWVEERDG